MAIELDELELVWPAELFAAEATALLSAGCTELEDLGWLLAEAFHANRGFRLFQQVYVPQEFLYEPWGAPTSTFRPAPASLKLVDGLVREADRLPRHEPQRYYSARRNPQLEPPPLTAPQATEAFALVVADLARHGYFEDAFGSSCLDARDDDPDAEGQRHLAELVDTDRRVWPLRADGQPTGLERDWPEELFYDVVEALHDLAARPRRRSWHEFGREWDYSDYTRAPGQAVYRWRVNALLAGSEVALRLAESGSDRGQLVQATGDPRDQLMRRALSTPSPVDRDEVEHAVQMFRSRHAASRDDKRSAVVALARVLEHRRQLLKQELLSKDEGALFEVANRYDLRHRNANQHADYADAYLDWVFWWYLATVELTDRLLARQAGTP